MEEAKEAEQQVYSVGVMQIGLLRQRCVSKNSRPTGLWLRGNGDGSFRSVGAGASGLELFGEQRGAAAADFDGDGRVDLAIAQNSGETKLYRNRQSEPGIRVILVGEAPNPNAVGALVRAKYGSELGPLREITAGEGYWSQNSHVQVFPRAGLTGLWVRWPGGEIQDLPLLELEREVS